MISEIKIGPGFRWGKDRSLSGQAGEKGYTVTPLVLRIDCTRSQLRGIEADLNYLVGDGNDSIVKFSRFIDDPGSPRNNGMFIEVRSGTNVAKFIGALQQVAEDYNMARSTSEEEIPNISLAQLPLAD